MLHEFLLANHEELERRCRAKSAERSHGVSSGDSAYGIPHLIAELVDVLRDEHGPDADLERTRRWTNVASSAGLHGDELLQRGFTVDQVVRDYGDLCQAITELASETRQSITVDEFRTFNRCLDNATADAVGEFSRARDRQTSNLTAATMNERLGSLAHELRNQLGTAILAFRTIKNGSVAVSGATGGMLERSLHNLQQIVDRSLAEVRMTAGMPLRRESIAIDQLVSELRIPVVMEAFTRGLVFSSSVGKGELFVEADRQMVASAVANLLQNALKFTRPHGRLSMAARAMNGHVLIEVKDECGGLPDGKTEQLFEVFEQHGANRSGLGLGLSISRRSIEANGGTLTARDLPGTGCIFTIRLPSQTA